MGNIDSMKIHDIDAHMKRCRDKSQKSEAKETYDLKLDSLSLKIHCSNFKVHSNCTNVSFSVGVILYRNRFVKKHLRTL